MPRRTYYISTPIVHTFVINGESSYTGTTFQLTCSFDNIQVSASSWSITIGNQYASISNGELTINQNANNSSITISATYQTYTATFQTIVTYYQDIQHTLEIIGPVDEGNNFEGETIQLTALYDGMALPVGANPTWEFINYIGGEDTIDSNGFITIDRNNPEHHPLEIRCEYNNTEDVYNINVLYQQGSESIISTETSIDPETGEVSTSITNTTQNNDGSSTSTTNTTTTDSNGNVIGTSQSETNTQSDGSSTTTTTNYDANGTPTSGSNNTVDTQGNSNTQTFEYNNGNQYINGYTIDTSNNSNGGETLNNSPVNTGMIVFDGKGFEMNLTFKSNLGNNIGNMIFAAMEFTGQGGNQKHSGFELLNYKSGLVNFYAGKDSKLNTSSGVFGTIIDSSNIESNYYSRINEYNIFIRFLPANYPPNTNNYSQVYFHLTSNDVSITNGEWTSDSNDSGYIPNSLSNAQFVLGGNGLNNTFNMINFEVISFEVHKI